MLLLLLLLLLLLQLLQRFSQVVPANIRASVASINVSDSS